MSNQITAKYMKLPMMSVFLGSCLALVTYPVQGQINNNHRVLLTQLSEYSQNQPIEFYQAPQYYNQNFPLYSVYVDSNSDWTLQQIRRLVEPSAYFQRYNGRSVIMSGKFSQRANAERRLKELNAIGIYNARVDGLNNGQETPPYSGNGNSGNYGSKSRYYVTIPTKPEDLSIVTNQVRQVTGLNNVTARRQPLGPHVAIGPFKQRTEAERWNNIIRDRGFGNARVYYDR